jgi:hypothetical protein
LVEQIFQFRFVYRLNTINHRMISVSCRVALVVAICFAFDSPRAAARDKTAEISLSHPERRDAKADCESAIKRGDLRFVAVMGVAMEAPGGEKCSHLYESNGVKVIAGTSDVHPVGDVFNKNAREYARKYNAALCDYIRRRSKSQ